MTGSTPVDAALMVGLVVLNCWAMGSDWRERGGRLFVNVNARRWNMPPTPRWDIPRGACMIPLLLVALLHDAVTLRRREHWVGFKERRRS